jgi:CRISPR/Cas system-associated protein Cas10 (large subunit of type III CRISPR-Cas system)
MLADFGSERRLFSPKQLELLTSIGLTIGEGRHPARKSAEIAISLLEAAKEQGFQGH